MSLKSIPEDLETARACLVCSLIKSFEQFQSDGCDNCERFLRMKNNVRNVFDCTSPKFEGIIALMTPDDSWVAKWNKIDKFIPGIYASTVAGNLPQKFIKKMKANGMTYTSKDKKYGNVQKRKSKK